MSALGNWEPKLMGQMISKLEVWFGHLGRNSGWLGVAQEARRSKVEQMGFLNLFCSNEAYLGLILGTNCILFP
jgi:hypothetical protein